MLGITDKKRYQHKEVFEYIGQFDFMQSTISKINTKEFSILCDNLEYGDFIYNRAKDFSSLIKLKGSSLKLLHFKRLK